MKSIFTLVAVSLLSLAAFSQNGELVFSNAVLKSGVANTPGAVYRFNNVRTGVDAEVKIKRFSRPDIVMSTIDNSTLGWNKSFQPEFGLPGNVAPNQEWHVDFEMIFYNAGTMSKKKMDSVVLTAIDIDGDGQSLREYVIYDRPASVTNAVNTSLTTLLTGVLGVLHTCSQDNLPSILQSCNDCDGDGYNNSGSGTGNECGECEGSGRIHLLCQHAYRGCVGTKATGPQTNYTNIDTASTQVMSTYRFYDKERIVFTYGANSGSSYTTAGIRMNSSWFRAFSLAPMNTLPVKFASFTATLNNNNKADLKWTTVSEVNVNHFIIEKSYDGTNFDDAGMMFAYGNPTDLTSYSFSDNLSTTTAKVIYYRIRSVDADLRKTYTETRIIRLGKEQNDLISIMTYPNPVSNELRVTIPSEWQNKKVLYEVFNSNGTVARKIETGSAGQTESINVSTLSSGYYLVRVSCNGQTAQQKIVKH